jgi:hypothetical protein
MAVGDGTNVEPIEQHDSHSMAALAGSWPVDPCDTASVC